MKRWIAAGLVVAAAASVSAAAVLGAFARSESSAAGAPDGIAVTGDWEITVKNRDGSVARVHRFQNAFDGASNIAPILAHASATGRYWLTLSSTAGTHPCGDAGPAACFIFEDDDPNASVTGFFGGLTVANPIGQIVITGEVEATRDGDFNHVRMLLSRCVNTTAPSACHPGAYGQFSSRTLPAPVSLVTGQQAIVTVTYTFSAA